MGSCPKLFLTTLSTLNCLLLRAEGAPCTIPQVPRPAAISILASLFAGAAFGLDAVLPIGQRRSPRLIDPLWCQSIFLSRGGVPPETERRGSSTSSSTRLLLPNARCAHHYYHVRCRRIADVHRYWGEPARRRIPGEIPWRRAKARAGPGRGVGEGQRGGSGEGGRGA